MGGRKRKRARLSSNGTHTTTAEAGADNHRPKRLRLHPNSPFASPPVNPGPRPPSLTIPSPPTLPGPSKTTSKATTSEPSPKPCHIPTPASVHHPVLSQYFPCLLSLHAYLRHVLVCSRRSGCLKRLGAIDKNTDAELLAHLETTLVGLRKNIGPGLVLDVADATQLSAGSRPSTCSQSEFRAGPLGIDVVNFYPNTHVTTLKSKLWAGVFKIIGEEPMLDLLLNTSIFVKLDEGNDVSKSNYYQLAGPPISDSLNKPFPQGGSESPAPNSGGSVRARSVGESLKRPVTEIGSAIGAKRAKITNANGPNNETAPTRILSHVELGKHRDLRTPGEMFSIDFPILPIELTQYMC
ncbi:hypothetical protein B9Z19DRAFT_338687 [Tuber borchii]|uniref:Telomerase reverse transcriptase n=1 Tax=Tuber borchii TaxID=42251 RepID=A0A2T6ZJB7_TUBBO|nr:hypothetical protein B9Z19DRAFT_338687 [Tuber borchii]